MNNINELTKIIISKLAFILFLFIVIFTGCTSFQKEKNRLDSFAEKNLMLDEKQSLVKKIISNPDSFESIIKSSVFYNSIYTEIFLEAHMQSSPKVQKAQNIVSEYLKQYENDDFILSSNQTYIIGPNKLHWEYFHRLEYTIRGDRHEKLLTTFVLKDKMWYLVEMLVVGIYK